MARAGQIGAETGPEFVDCCTAETGHRGQHVARWAEQKKHKDHAPKRIGGVVSSSSRSDGAEQDFWSRRTSSASALTRHSARS